MTAELTPVPDGLPPVAPTNLPHIVVASTGTRLEQLHASYADLKAQADEAAKRLKAVTDGIKAELAAAEPGQERVELRSPVGPPLRMSYVESWRFDSKRLKTERPDLYVVYAVKGGSWQLRTVAGSDDE
ncbi:MAG TPA: hypothetical protein VLI04_08135 [Nocardioidaceae bacterium]|nr:hypothetical protein [Nocardioidaceae bacterium]